MSLKTKIVKRKNPQDKNAQPKNHVTSISRGRMEFEELLDQVCNDSTIDTNEVKLGINRTFKKVIESLLLGFTVHLGELGYFNIRISSKGVDNEKDATADTVYRKRLVFYPGAKLRKAIKEAKLERETPVIKK